MSDNAAPLHSATREPASPKRRSPVTRLILLALVSALFVVWFSPYWAIAGLAQAAQAHDAPTVSQYVDLPRLNSSLKDGVAMATEAELSKHKGKALQIVGAALSVLAADQVVDKVVTPEVITSVVALKLQNFQGSRLSYAFALATDSRAGWLTDSTFQIRLGNESAMYWTRDGLNWRLGSVKMR
jgi:hypothetical protein